MLVERSIYKFVIQNEQKYYRNESKSFSNYDVDIIKKYCISKKVFVII